MDRCIGAVSLYKIYGTAPIPAVGARERLLTPGEPILCAVCGHPVRKLGAVKWSGSGDPPDGYLTGLYPVCVECVSDPGARLMVDALIPEALN